MTRLGVVVPLERRFGSGDGEGAARAARGTLTWPGRVEGEEGRGAVAGEGRLRLRARDEKV